MSSDSTTSIQASETARLQGMRPASAVPVTPALNAAKRNESAAGGQDVPPTKVNKEADVSHVQTAVSEISDFVQNFHRDLLFTIDKDSDRLVVKVVDSETDEVIRQIPSEETLRIARNLHSPESLILKEQA